APEVKLLGALVRVVLQEDVARADWDVGAAAIQCDDVPALDLEDRVAQDAVVVTSQEREVGDRIYFAVIPGTGVVGIARVVLGREQQSEFPVEWLECLA